MTQSQCFNCTHGAYCPGDGTADPVLCSDGTYNPLPGQSSSFACIDCDAGWACPTSGMSFLTTRCRYATLFPPRLAPALFFWVALPTHVSLCSPGHYCPEGTSDPSANACAAGRYTERNDLISAAQCDRCPPRVACLSGTGGGNPPVPCAAGHYCPERTRFSTQYNCPAGRFSPETNLASADECTSCPEGQFCAGGADAPDGDCGAFCV